MRTYAHHAPAAAAAALAIATLLAPAPARTAPRPAPAGRVVVESPRGSLEITGWDRDTVEATASVDGRVVQLTVIAGGPSGAAFFVSGAELRGASIVVRVKVPRSSPVEATDVRSGSITATGVEGDLELKTTSGNIEVAGGASVSAGSGSGNVAVTGASGDVSLRAASGNVAAARVGGARVTSSSGNVMVESANGPVTAEAQSGNVMVKGVRGACRVNALSGNVVVEDVTGDVLAHGVSGRVSVTNVGGNARAFSASDDVTIDCVGGQVEAESASGNVRIRGAGGDVDANSASGNVTLTARLRPNGRYRLKTVSGDAIFWVQGEPAGFTASLSSFSGETDTEFELGPTRQLAGGPAGMNRRLEGTHGDGAASVTLSAFSGSARVARAHDAGPACGGER